MKYLVVDIGGSFVKYAIMDKDANFIFKNKFETPKNSKEELIEAIGKIYDCYNDVNLISVSIPGIVDPESGYVYMGGALSYNNGFDFKKALKQRCNNLPIVINNDAKCAAKAEASLGALSDVKDGLVILLGTMIGGGIVFNHQVRVGKHFSCGEVSYIVTDKDSYPLEETIWGRRCSVLRLCEKYAELKGVNPNMVNGETVFIAIEDNDEKAITALDAYSKEIAVQLFNIQTVLDVEKIAIGGGVSAQDILIEYIQKHLEQMYKTSPYYVPEVKITSCKFKNDANLVGALKFALE